MPCEIKNDMIICSRGKHKPPKCAFCPRPSTKLCDYLLDGSHTCDAPICDEHSKKQGINLDTCPNHSEMKYF